LQFLDRFVETGDVREGDLRLILRHEARLRLAERHHAVPAALHLLHQEEEETDDDQDRKELEQYREEHGTLLRIGAHIDAVLYRELRVRGDRVLREVDLVLLFGVQRADGLLVLVEELDRDDLAALDAFDPLVNRGEFFRPIGALAVQVEDPYDRDDQYKVEECGSEDAVHRDVSVAACLD
jgi:hypothetical protein